MNPLILVGGGGHCKSVIDVATSGGYFIHGILDLEENIGKKVLDWEIIGSDDSIIHLVEKFDFVVTAGQIKESNLRRLLHEKITNAGGRFATIVSPRAYVSKYASVGKGTAIMHHSTINAEVEVGFGCIINTMANIEHEVTIGNYTHISTGAMINGGCNIGQDCFIGSQAVLAQGVKVVNGSIISAGSFLKNDAEIPGIYFGNPAKRLNK